ncbi:MAG: LysM peptidoglycan-binding domain-containing protein [Candidatus Marinimicrobia bacterium]|nr:LysM peptidoglycan-binding domain-containing protein [Candidatus Neomarinimicrobiota bacterium]
MKNLHRFHIFLRATAILGILCAQEPATREVYILHTNNTNGALENCLCPGKSYGSLEKRVQYIRDWLKDHPNTLLVDAGDFLSASRKTLKDSIAFRAYEMIPYDAVGLGDQEFFRGVNFLEELVEESTLPFISTNLTRPQFSNLEREKVITKNGISFGILSVIDPGVFSFYPARVKEAVEVAAYTDVLKGRLTDLADRVDVVVVLSHMGVDADRELAAEYPQIDVIVGSHTQTVMTEPEMVGNTLIVQAGKDGYYVGQLKLTFDGSKTISVHEGSLVAMDIVLPNDPAVIDMIIEYNRLSGLKVGKRVERIVPVPPAYLVSSSQQCASCHEGQFDHWAVTGHARSLATLKHDHKEKSPDCLACHTTGFGRSDGYLNYNITGGLKNVNCTECHYTPAEHLSEPAVHTTLSITEEKCIRCHDQNNSPDFAFADFMGRSRHPVTEVEVAEVPVPLTNETVEKVEIETVAELTIEEEIAVIVESEDEEAATVVATLEQPEDEPDDAVALVYIVQPGESLWKIAKQQLGKGARWEEIYDLNRNMLKSPHLIRPGQELKIPAGGE